MSVITISRGTFSGGKMLAECLAKKLGYRCVDRDVIVERASASGVSQEDLLAALVKPPSFLDRFQHKKYIYLALIQNALAEEVRAGKAVYHGNAGHLLLSGGSTVLRTRIIAPLEFRLKMAQKRLKTSQGDALAYIEKTDGERRKWTQFLYGVDWGDPALYDIVINLEHVTIEQACEVIAKLAKKRCFEFTPECQRKMNDLVLASRVRAALAVNEATSGLEVEVTARDGAVAIKGRLARLQQADEVRKIAQNAQGVKSVNIEEMTDRAHA